MIKVEEPKKVCVIGLGYIGLPTASLLANRSYYVHGVDVRKEVVEMINRAEKTIAEPGLDTFLKSAIQSKKLHAALEPDHADIFIIAVPTPFKQDHQPDLSAVFRGVESILPYLRNGNRVILESTSPVGTTEAVYEMMIKERPDITELYVAYCPERVLPGHTMKELIQNDRIVGGIIPEAAFRIRDFYTSFVEGEVFTTDAWTAELSKLAENAFRDVNIAFANELSIICDRFGIDVWELIRLANRHPRVNILHPGSGVGGHCIAVDPWFIITGAPEEARLMHQARMTNNYKPQWIIANTERAITDFRKNSGREPVVACMGITFKPDIDDLRESPSLYITRELIKRGHTVLVVEPNIHHHEELTFTDTEQAVSQADIILFLLAHKEFKNLTIPLGKKVIDVCGILAQRD